MTNDSGEQKIKRYEWDYDSSDDDITMREWPDGDWIKYEDHAKEVERLKAETESYKKAKQENDERFMIERDEARASNAKLREALEVIREMKNTEWPDRIFVAQDIARQALADCGEK